MMVSLLVWCSTREFLFALPMLNVLSRGKFGFFQDTDRNKIEGFHKQLFIVGNSFLKQA
jgi:hypothetical protein